MEDNGSGSPCERSEESLRKAAQPVIDQQSLGCPQFWMYVCIRWWMYMVFQSGVFIHVDTEINKDMNRGCFAFLVGTISTFSYMIKRLLLVDANADFPPTLHSNNTSFISEAKCTGIAGWWSIQQTRANHQGRHQ